MPVVHLTAAAAAAGITSQAVVRMEIHDCAVFVNRSVKLGVSPAHFLTI